MSNRINIEAILQKNIKKFHFATGSPFDIELKAAIKEIVELVIDKCENLANIKEVKKVEMYDYADKSNYGIDSQSILQVKKLIDYES